MSEPSYGLIYNNPVDSTNGETDYVLLYDDCHKPLFSFPHEKAACFSKLKDAGFLIGPTDGLQQRGWFKIFRANATNPFTPAYLLVVKDAASVYTASGGRLNYPACPPDCFAALGRDGYKIVGGDKRQDGWFRLEPRTSDAGYTYPSGYKVGQKVRVKDALTGPCTVTAPAPHSDPAATLTVKLDGHDSIFFRPTEFFEPWPPEPARPAKPVVHFWNGFAGLADLVLCGAPLPAADERSNDWFEVTCEACHKAEKAKRDSLNVGPRPDAEDELVGNLSEAVNGLAHAVATGLGELARSVERESTRRWEKEFNALLDDVRAVYSGEFLDCEGLDRLQKAITRADDFLRRVI